jgi:hypothetical protein
MLMTAAPQCAARCSAQPILNRTLRSEQHSSVTRARNRLRGHVPQQDFTNSLIVGK